MKALNALPARRLQRQETAESPTSQAAPAALEALPADASDDTKHPSPYSRGEALPLPSTWHHPQSAANPAESDNRARLRREARGAETSTVMPSTVPGRRES